MQLIDTTIDFPMDWNEAVLEPENFPQVITYHGPTCNYQGDCAQAGSSRSICGLVALNCARLALKAEAEDAESFPRRLISQAMVDEMMTIANLNDLKVESHLNIEELLEIPVFQETLIAKPTTNNIRSLDGLRDILSNWFSDTSTKVHVAAFSSNTEVIVCLKIPFDRSNLYALYDSHSRPNHRDGPAFTLSGDLDELSEILHQILLQSNVAVSKNSTLEKISAYVLELKADGHKRDIHDMLTRSAVYLSRRQMGPDALTNEPFSESDHLSLLRTRAETLRKIRSQEFPDSQPISSTSSKSEHSRGKKPSTEPHHRGEFGWQLSLLLNPPPVSANSGNHEHDPKQASVSSDNASYSISNKENIPPVSGIARQSDQGWLTSFVHGSTEEGQDDITPPLPPKDEPISKSVQTLGRGGEFGWQLALQQQSEKETGAASGKKMSSKAVATGQQAKDDDAWETALIQQLQEEEEITASLSNHLSGEHAWLVALQKRMQNEESTDSNGAGSSSLSRSELDWQLAVQLQQEVYRDEGFDTVQEPSPRIVVECDEDGDMVADAPPSYSRNSNYLRVPPWRGSEDTSTFTTLDIPNQSSSQQFECGVCAEMHDVTEKLSLAECGHNFCKDCLTTFTKTKIEEGRYPIFCPECLAQRLRNSKSQVTQDIVDKLNITKDELQRLEELQLVAHSITLECPRCKESMNVDREQYGEQSVITCPLPRCGHRWCKSCLKTLASSEENHRCKNGNIDRLMRKKGWKYCPGCRTPVQKESGCNHMTCGAPGCNVHFCYKCGVLMIDTTDGGDVGTAVTEHYLNCRLFEKRLKCSIQ